MFTDIVAYTALMGEDEQKAFAILRKNRQLQKPFIEKYGGKWMKELGDGVLASFSTVTDAVMCACEIQAACKDISDLKLRIGIHLGEVVFENKDVFGDGVNIASRLQALAPIGSTFISEAVYKNISNKKEFVTELIGEQVLKNVAEPVRVYEIKPKEGAVYQHKASQHETKPIFRKITAIPILITALILVAVLASYLFLKQRNIQAANVDGDEKSVAVLPFENLSGDSLHNYFSEGIAIEILNALSQLEGLKVPGRASALWFKGKNIDLKEVGEKLHVKAVLEGSVRIQDSHVKIDVQLVNIADGFTLWSQQYERTLDDVLAIQEEIAKVVVKKLKVTLLKNEKLDIAQGLTKNKEAYDLYLKARSSWDERNLKESERYFLEAVKLDPYFAAAWAGLGDTYILFPQFGVASPRESCPRAEQAARRAIQLDSTMAIPYFTMAFKSFMYGDDTANTTKNFQKGFQLNDNYSPGHYWYANYLTSFDSRDSARALKEVKRSIDLDPLGSIPYLNLGLVLMRINKWKEAIAALQTSVELSDKNATARFWIGFCYVATGDMSSARKWFKEGAELGHEGSVAALSYILFKEGRKDQAEMLFNQLIDLSKAKYVNHFPVACAAATLGKKDLANELLKQSIEEGELIRIRLFAKSPFIKALLSDPRNVELLKQLE